MTNASQTISVMFTLTELLFFSGKEKDIGQKVTQFGLCRRKNKHKEISLFVEAVGMLSLFATSSKVFLLDHPGSCLKVCLACGPACDQKQAPKSSRDLGPHSRTHPKKVTKFDIFYNLKSL